jgi:hypothetical protein
MTNGNASVAGHGTFVGEEKSFNEAAIQGPMRCKQFAPEPIIHLQ